MNFRQTLALAVVSAIVSIATAVITTRPQVMQAEQNQKQIDQVERDIAEKDSIIKYKEFPVGTIIASTLSFETFCLVNGSFSPNDFDPSNPKCEWSPADGRDVRKSRFGDIAKGTVPDLRGMFQRGANSFDLVFESTLVSDKQKDVGERDSEGFQKDAIGAHSHTLPLSNYNEKIEKSDNYHRQRAIFGNGTSETYQDEQNSSMTVETRPRNLALFYYIKIN